MTSSSLFITSGYEHSFIVSISLGISQATEFRERAKIAPREKTRRADWSYFSLPLASRVSALEVIIARMRGSLALISILKKNKDYS